MKEFKNMLEFLHGVQKKKSKYSKVEVEECEFYQYPFHLIKSIGINRWNAFNKIFLKETNRYRYPYRWKYLKKKHLLNANILDVGCNTGSEVAKILDNFEINHIDCIDYNVVTCDIFEDFMGAYDKTKFSVQVLDVLKNPDYKFNKKFDVITFMGSVIENIPSDNEGIIRWENNIKLMVKFILNNKPKHLYFLTFEKEFIDFIQEELKIKYVLLDETYYRKSCDFASNWEPFDEKNKIKDYYVYFNMQ